MASIVESVAKAGLTGNPAIILYIFSNLFIT